MNGVLDGMGSDAEDDNCHVDIGSDVSTSDYAQSDQEATSEDGSSNFPQNSDIFAMPVAPLVAYTDSSEED